MILSQMISPPFRQHIREQRSLLQRFYGIVGDAPGHRLGDGNTCPLETDLEVVRRSCTGCAKEHQPETVMLAAAFRIRGSYSRG